MAATRTRQAKSVKGKRRQTKAAPAPVAEPVRKLLYNTREAAVALGICEKTLYRHLLTGDLFSLRIGARRCIPLAAMEAYIARQMAEGAV